MVNNNVRDVQGVSPFLPEYQEFLKNYPGRGTLKIQATVADGSFPLKDVRVNVSKIIDGKRYLLYSDVTDQSGIVDNIVLPAESGSDSLNPETAGGAAVYQVSLYHPSFKEITDCNVRIFDKVETILPALLEPLTGAMEEI